MFKITGYVVDEETEDPIPGVTIYLINEDGSRSEFSMVNDEGDFSFEQPTFGSKVEFSYPGYEPQEVDPAYIGFRPIVMKQKTGSTLGEVVVKSIRPSKGKKPNYVLPVAIGSLAVIAFAVSFKF